MVGETPRFWRAVNFGSQLGDLVQLLAPQRFGGVEIGEPVFQIGGEIALAPAMAPLPFLCLGRSSAS